MSTMGLVAKILGVTHEAARQASKQLVFSGEVGVGTMCSDLCYIIALRRQDGFPPSIVKSIGLYFTIEDAEEALAKKLLEDQEVFKSYGVFKCLANVLEEIDV